MKNALDDINAAFTKSTGIKVTASYGANSALMKQIEQGAPADVFGQSPTIVGIEWNVVSARNALTPRRDRLNEVQAR